MAVGPRHKKRAKHPKRIDGWRQRSGHPLAEAALQATVLLLEPVKLEIVGKIERRDV